MKKNALKKKMLKQIRIIQNSKKISMMITKERDVSQIYHNIFVLEFKTYRRVMFALRKTLKYTAWASIALFWYHMYLLKKTENPEKGFLANEAFLNMAKFADWSFYDLKLLLTRPPVEKLLPDRPPLPPGAAYPKTLVINMRGTLVHSEYKVSFLILAYIFNIVWNWL